MSSGFFVRVFTSMVDTVPGTGNSRVLSCATEPVVTSGVRAKSKGARPTGMSAGFLILVFESMVDTVSLLVLPWATKAVLPSGVSATVIGAGLTAMSSGSLCFRLLRALNGDAVITVEQLILDACPSPAPWRDGQLEGSGTDGDVVGVLRAGLHVDGRYR